MDSEQRFQQRRDDAEAQRDELAGRASRVSNLRLAVFAVGVGALIWAEVQPELGGWALALFGLALAGFVVLVIIHSRLTEREQWAAEMAAVNRESLARLRRDWDALPEVAETGPPGHAYARDLDVYGHGSLARFLATTGTGVGRDRLHDWLLAPATAEEVRTRQAAVQELAPELEFRQTLQVAGRLAGDPDPAALAAFLDWAESEPWLLLRPLLLWTARLLPVATAALFFLNVRGVLVRPWWILTLAAGVVLTLAVGKRLHRLMAGASLGDASIRKLADLVARIRDTSFRAPALQAIHATLTDECDAAREMDRIGWLTELAEFRHGGLFWVLLHIPTLWDFHVLAALERWKTKAGRHVRDWGDAVARLDALCALAGPIHDEPGWSFPEIAPGHSLEAAGLAHPLLAPDERVANDVTVGPPGSYLMVTGSNMSGKSTLLRAIGVNAVLAEAGGPVCAKALTLPPLDLRTSMRVDDSLERGISLFMAELQQLKRVVDAADAASDRLLLYLLDEVLHGTNSAERQVAIREVIGHLLERRAIGAISTHDLSLADEEPLKSAVVPVHFRETVHPEGHEPAMTFDYRLRDGVATSTNAMKLVRLVGLARPEAR